MEEYIIVAVSVITDRLLAGHIAAEHLAERLLVSHTDRVQPADPVVVRALGLSRFHGSFLGNLEQDAVITVYRRLDDDLVRDFSRDRHLKSTVLICGLNAGLFSFLHLSFSSLCRLRSLGLLFSLCLRSGSFCALSCVGSR